MPLMCACANHVWAQLSNRPGVTLVSPEDANWLEGRSWYADKKGYVRSEIKRVGVGLHRAILRPQQDQLVDHRNHWKQDNRRENLRSCDDAQSIRNRRKFGFSKSKYKGVSYYKSNPTKPWVARIETNGKRKYLGHFYSESEAGRAYDAAAVILHGEFACMNFMEVA